MMRTEEITITVEGIVLRGRVYWPDPKTISEEDKGKPLLILCHGIPRGNQPSGESEEHTYQEDGGYPALAGQSCEAGLPCFHFNFRGTGDSEGNFDLLGWTRDLIGVLDYWEKRGFGKNGFYLWGFSAGAAVSCHVASSDPQIKAVLLAASPAEFKSIFLPRNLEQIILRLRGAGIIRDSYFPADPHRWLEDIHSVSPISIIHKISPRPLLVIHGDADELIPFEHAHRLYEQAGDPKQLYIIPGAEHQLRKNKEAVFKCLDWLKNL
ncbi:MAG: alpha/beta fold hydrolase [Bacillota bacterium]|nr:alpha/beta fold hydrolase [Bacillota bacterium]